MSEITADLPTGRLAAENQGVAELKKTVSQRKIDAALSTKRSLENGDMLSRYEAIGIDITLAILGLN